jgi:transposase
MKGIRYTDEFKSEAVKQITERGHDVADVAQRLGVSTKSLYKWRHELALSKSPVMNADILLLKQEVARLNKALKRATEERDILKKAAVYFASQPE